MDIGEPGTPLASQQPPVLQELYTLMEAEVFASLAENPEWWVTLIIMHEYFKLINMTLSETKRKLHFLEKQDLRLVVLRKDIAGLRVIVEDMDFDETSS